MAKILGESGEWVLESGPYVYINQSGEEVYGNGNHRHNLLTGENLPIRQFQNQQKVAKAAQGIPIPTRQRRVSRSGAYYTKYRPNTLRHGDTVALYFRNLLEAQLWFYEQYEADPQFFQKYDNWVIQARYTSRNLIRFGGSIGMKSRGGKFTTLSTSYATSTLMVRSDIMWNEATNRLEQGFTMGDDSAVILFGVEY